MQNLLFEIRDTNCIFSAGIILLIAHLRHCGNVFDLYLILLGEEDATHAFVVSVLHTHDIASFHSLISIVCFNFDIGVN